MSYIAMALRQHANVDHGMKYAQFYKQWFYTLKVIICLLINREGRNVDIYQDYPVTIAWTDGGKYWSEYGTAYWSERLCTGYGVLRGWYYVVAQDSSQ